MANVDHVLYNGLPSLEEATERYQTPSVNELMNGPIRQLFIKHGAYRDFCLYLQHCHHTVSPGQAIVKVNGTAHVMDEDGMHDIEQMGHQIVPATWMGAGLVPAEFSVVPAGALSKTPSARFVDELSELLVAHGYDGLFGIDTKSESDWFELTVGGSSVVVPSNGEDLHGYLPVAFAFDEDEKSFKVHGKCGKDHKHTSKPSRN